MKAADNEMMTPQVLLKLLPMFALLAVAAAIDLRTRRIPNWLTLGMAITGLLQSFLPQHAATPLQALCGLLLGFALNLPFFVLQIRGGGDLKLFAALGTWLGPMATFEIFLVSTIVAMLVSLIQCAATGKLTALFKNTAVLAVSIAHPKELGVAYTTRADGSFVSVGGHLPYALPIIVATAWVMTRGGLF